MIRLEQAVIVEGKYDKIKLAALLDAPIITTDGFGVFRNAEKLGLIRRLAQQRGVILLTDSDGAGFVIRNKLAGMLPKEQVTHVYIPDLFGKERRKSSPSAEGKLGVEGMPVQILLDAFAKAGVTASQVERPARRITRLDLYEAGISGRPDAAARRKKLLRAAGLPERLSSGALLQILNVFLTYDQWRKLVKDVLEEDGV